MTWSIYLIIIAVFGLIFFSVAVYALSWAVKKGQLRDFDKQATVIFDDEEPEGLHTDAFPGKHGKDRISKGPRGFDHTSQGNGS